MVITIAKAKNIYVVGGVIIAKNYILCAKRGNTKTLPYKWEFPGGKVQHGETKKTALKREIEEEMQIKVQVGQQVDHTLYEYHFGVVHLTTFYCTILEGKPTLTEHHSIKWLKVEELLKLDWAPADIPTVNKLVNS